MSGTVRASVDIQKMSKRKYVHGKCIKMYNYGHLLWNAFVHRYHRWKCF